MRELKGLYSQVEHSINQSSLVLYHGPLFHASIMSALYHCPLFRFCNSCGPDVEHSGTLLTGDIDLTKLLDHGRPFREFLADHPSVGVFLLPHHGSYKNTSVNLLRAVLFPPCTFVCSYGRHNQFKHPDPYMLDQLEKNIPCIVQHCTQQQECRYTIIAR